MRAGCCLLFVALVGSALVGLRADEPWHRDPVLVALADDAGAAPPEFAADALIRIVDPGTQAVGFELDVCLPASGGVRCANPVETASQ